MTAALSHINHLLSVLRSAHPDPPHGTDGRFYSAGSASASKDPVARDAAAHPRTADGAPIGGAAFTAHRESEHLRASLTKLAQLEKTQPGIKSAAQWRGHKGYNAIANHRATLEMAIGKRPDHQTVRDLQALYHLYQQRLGLRGTNDHATARLIVAAGSPSAARLRRESAAIQTYLARFGLKADLAPNQQSSILPAAQLRDLRAAVDATLAQEQATQRVQAADVLRWSATAWQEQPRINGKFAGTDKTIPAPKMPTPEPASKAAKAYVARMVQKVRDATGKGTQAEKDAAVAKMRKTLASTVANEADLEQRGSHKDLTAPSTIQHLAALEAQRHLMARYEAGDFTPPTPAKAKTGETVHAALARVSHDGELLSQWGIHGAHAHGSPDATAKAYKQELALLDQQRFFRNAVEQTNRAYTAKHEAQALTKMQDTPLFQSALAGKAMAAQFDDGSPGYVHFTPQSDGRIQVDAYTPKGLSAKGGTPIQSTTMSPGRLAMLLDRLTVTQTFNTLSDAKAKSAGIRKPPKAKRLFTPDIIALRSRFATLRTAI